MEQSLEDIGIATRYGPYSESKAVAEKVIERATNATALKATILRMGQVSGNRHGTLNVSDWFPVMIKSSLALRSLPEVERVSSCILSMTLRLADDISNSRHRLE
jgi:thioester reductase-like protein